MGFFRVGFGDGPRLEVVDVFVDLLDFGPDVVESLGIFKIIHEAQVFFVGGVRNFGQLDGIFDAEDGETLDEVAEVVGEFAGIGGIEFFPSEVRIGKSINVAEEEVAERVEAVFVEDFERVDDVAEGFGHFLAAAKNVAVGKNDFRRRQVEGEQNGGPDDGVETKDVFANELNVGGPKVGDVGFGIAKDGEIVGEGVDPDVHDLVFVAWDGDAPRKIFLWAGDGDVGRRF